MSVKVIRQKQQSGAALILFVLLLVVGATTLLVSKVNKAATQYYRDDVTTKALLKAKEALLGYAITYSSSTNDTIGPGYLPCPDASPPETPGNTGSGFSQSGCGGSVNLIGRFPWRSLGLPDVRDSSGETLWYVLSRNFRTSSHVQPMNSEIGVSSGVEADMLSLNGTGDIAAIIFAPGSPLTDDNRIDGNLIDASHYLEDSDGDFLDTDFVTPDGSNDIYLVLTKQELMREVEKRVLGEVANSLNLYRNNYQSFPWLSEYESVASSGFSGQVGIREGHLPIHVANEVFNTNFTVNWNITDSDGATIIPTATIDRSTIESGSINVLGRCSWRQDSTDQGRNTVECEGTTTQTDPVTGATLTYRVDIGFSEQIQFTGTSNPLDDINPSTVSMRTRAVSLSGVSLPTQTSSTPLIEISDGLGSATLTIENTTTPSLFEVSGISYDLNTFSGQNELPTWFVSNNWHHLMYVAYSPGFEPGPIGSQVCTSGSSGDCLTIINMPGVNDNIEALVMSAGPDLTLETDRLTVGISDYFENQNNQPVPSINDITFEQNAYPQDWSTFNDQIKIVLP